MRFSFFSSIFILSLIPYTNAIAASPYFAIRTGITEVEEKEYHDETDASMFGSGAIGLRMGPLRLEGEYAHLGKAEDKKTNEEAQLQRVMANTYLDFKISRYVAPFVGAGVGIAFHKLQNNTKSKESSDFAWNAGAGIGVKVGHGVTLEGGYRYVDMGNATVQDKDLHFTAHETYAGIRFGF